MTSHPTTMRLDDRTRQQIDELDGELSTVIRRALDHLHRIETTGDLWVGAGPWRGWRISTAHAASICGQPVLVRPDGTAMGPGDLNKENAPA